MEKINVCVIGSGSWATVLAKIVGENALILEEVAERVNMFVYEEIYEDTQLSNLINTLHVNKKYAPDVQLPENVVAVTNLIETARYADIIIFVTPPTLLVNFCKTLLGKIKPSAFAISLTNGFITDEKGVGLQLASHTIIKYLKIPCAVLTAANLGIIFTVQDSYCEATLGCRDLKNYKLLGDIFKANNFRVNVIDDADCVEVCGFLKYIVAFGAGLLDGYDCFANTKSACLRFGFLEMIRFVDVFYPGSKLSTFFESCGLADLITVCSGSRDRRLAAAFVKSNISLEELEQQLLSGEKLLGPLAANAVSMMLQQKGLEDKFPLFTIIHKICKCIAKPQEILNCLLNIPDIIYHPTNTLPL